MNEVKSPNILVLTVPIWSGGMAGAAQEIKNILEGRQELKVEKFKLERREK